MQTITLNVQPREVGKKAAKAIRNEGSVPCVLYGSNTEPVHFSVATLELRPLVHTSETYLVALSIGGEDHECIVKTVDFHPITDTPIHMDFQALTRGEAITITVPIHLEGMAQGVKDGGNLSQPLNELEIRCLPQDIPGHFSVDVSGLNIGDSLHVSDLTIVDTIELITEPSRTIVNVAAPRIEVEPEEEGVLEMYDEEGNVIESAAPVGEEGVEAAEVGDEDSGE